MANNILGPLRRSALLSTFGPGAIVDFRVGDAPVSAVLAGLEEWDRRSPPAGILHPQTVFEPRLQKRLEVAGFRLPPVNVDDDETRADLIAVRFPRWLQCPDCHLIKPAGKWNQNPGDATRVCNPCTANRPGGQSVYVVPVRFVLACDHGHLDEFPWHFWVQHLPGCQTETLKLESEAAGLAGLILSCPKCKQRRSMEGIFSKRTFGALNCSGRRPWLAATPEPACQRVPRAVQRGASNLYFPVTVSALDIPPWSDNIQKQLGQFWDPIVQAPATVRPMFIATLMNSLPDIGLTAQELADVIEDRLKMLERPESKNLRWDEYLQFTSGRATAPQQEVEFEIRPETPPEELTTVMSHLVRAVRLREVRALSGFTRILAPISVADEPPPVQARLSVKPLKWLPAIEVRGEGIFIALDEVRLDAWESLSPVRDRIGRLREMFGTDFKERHPDEPVPDQFITPRFVLLHTFAHVLMRQLALNCGYSSASLRERLYAGHGETPMSGLLIYTATTDADGTLGGLARQGEPSRIGQVFIEALASSEWCSSDPLCIHELASAPDSFNLSACHACVLAAETSCEQYNRFLDRALLVGTPDEPGLGFFRSLLNA